MFHLMSTYVHTGSTHAHHGHRFLLRKLKGQLEETNLSIVITIIIVIISSSSSVNKLHHRTDLLQLHVTFLFVKPHDDEFCFDYIFPQIMSVLDF